MHLFYLESMQPLITFRLQAQVNTLKDENKRVLQDVDDIRNRVS